MLVARRFLIILAAALLLAPSALAHGPGERVSHAIEDPGPVNKAGPATVYPYYPLLTAELQRLADAHPDLVKLTSAGKSVLGLDIWMLEIADFGNEDMIPLEDREVVYIDGGTHSNEYSAVYFVTEIAQFLLDEYETNETAQWIVENRHTFIVPMVNADGSHVFGRLNANGVNVNRNFPVLWNAIDEMPVVNNPGPHAASEPETRTVITVVNETQPDFALSIHCCGNLWLYPYGVEGYEAPDRMMHDTICDVVFADVREDCGETWSTIYPASGITSDTTYEFAGAASFTYEMSGRGAYAPWGQPAITDDPREQERESWRGVMHAFQNVHRYGAHPILEGLAGDRNTLNAVVTNDGYGPLLHGNLTVGDTTVPLPELQPGERATLRVEGPFEAGETTVTLDWQKRIMNAPQGEKTTTLTLAEENGGLVAVLDGGERLTSSGAEPGRSIPAPAGLAVLAALVGLGIARRRRG